MTADHVFTFEQLINGRLGLTATYGAFLAEAASYCLHINNHANPVAMRLSGDLSASSSLQWVEIGEAHATTYADLEEATEYGAYGVAVIVAVQLTGFPRVARSAKGTGIDLWLASDSDHAVFQHAARLEVSGILKDKESRVTARTKVKRKQTERTDETLLPAYVAIVEFSSPETRLVKREADEGPR